MGCFLPSSFLCNSTPPIANPDASTSSSNCLSSSGCARTGSLVTRVLRISNASCCFCPQCHSVSLRVSSFRGRATWEKPRMKGL